MPDESKSFAFVQAQQQCAKGKSRGARFAPATDDGVHCLVTLQFHPVRASSGNVRAVGALRDDPFQTILFRQREQLFSVLQLMVGVAKPFRGVKQALQELLTIEEWAFAQIVSVTVEKIKGEVNDGYLCDQ